MPYYLSFVTPIAGADRQFVGFWVMPGWPFGVLAQNYPELQHFNLSNNCIRNLFSCGIDDVPIPFRAGSHQPWTHFLLEMKKKFPRFVRHRWAKILREYPLALRGTFTVHFFSERIDQVITRLSAVAKTVAVGCSYWDERRQMLRTIEPSKPGSAAFHSENNLFSNPECLRVMHHNKERHHSGSVSHGVVSTSDDYVVPSRWWGTQSLGRDFVVESQNQGMARSKGNPNSLRWS